ncbi:MAG: hypothetical protein Q8P19_00200 [bacterium]|nr:hypothetical protein [bacterium]
MTISKIIASGTLAALLLSAAPAFADTEFSAKGEGDMGLHLGPVVRMFAHEKAQARMDVHIGGKGRADADEDASAGEGKSERGEKHEGFFARLGDVKAGIVSGINGSVITLTQRGGKATTTVTTDASTVFKARGGATSSAALSVGSHAIVVGTTTATSSEGDTIAASLVIILKNGFFHMRHWLHLD